MKIVDLKALEADLAETLPSKAAKLFALIDGAVDPLDYAKALEQARLSVFTLKPWQTMMIALSDELKEEVNYTVDTSEGGLVAFVHLTSTKVLAYHTSHDSYRVLSYRHLTGINWYG